VKAVFRTDASFRIGTGHVMRCLTLADALGERGSECRFICREHPGNLLALIRQRGHAVQTLSSVAEGNSGSAAANDGPAHAGWLGTAWQTDAAQTRSVLSGEPVDWLIVDHYALDARWELQLRPVCRRLMAIDDLADRAHDCDLLLDQNLVPDWEHRYQGKVPAHCGLMLGPDYALLQPQYAELHGRVPLREGVVRSVLIYFGGADSDNVTGRSIAAFLSLRRSDVAVDVVINPASPHAEAIRSQLNGYPHITLHTSLPSLAPLMVRADLAIGGGGVTSWERCCLGLPSVVITLAENQRSIAAELDRRGVIRWLGHKDEVNETELAQALVPILQSALPATWSERCSRTVDGRGTERVVSILTLDPETPLRARLARLDDEALILGWANDPLVRRNAFNPGTIDPVTHHAWFCGRLRDIEHCRLYVVETHDGLPVGQVRFERAGEAWEVHYGLDARCRGRGIGAALLKTALLSFAATMAGSEIFGRVKPENNPSRRVFQRLGFVETWNRAELTYRHKPDSK
jgi:UDP-2,4-diacetamido-2,4,6-trideoxy-beta-L-altropyranose hydrolase